MDKDNQFKYFSQLPEEIQNEIIHTNPIIILKARMLNKKFNKILPKNIDKNLLYNKITKWGEVFNADQDYLVVTYCPSTITPIIRLMNDCFVILASDYYLNFPGRASYVYHFITDKNIYFHPNLLIVKEKGHNTLYKRLTLLPDESLIDVMKSPLYKEVHFKHL